MTVHLIHVTTINNPRQICESVDEQNENRIYTVTKKISKFK